MSLSPQIRFARSHDGVRLAYSSTGSGPTLIKAATWLSHLEYDWESPVWSHLLRDLSRQCTYVRYDERGCGLSDWSVDDLSFESWVRDLETVADACGSERFGLLGISQGASIAIAYAVRHPERVSLLVLHGGYARGRLVRSDTDQDREEVQTMTKLAELGWGKADASFRQFFTSQFIPGGTAEQHQWFNELERISTSPQNAARFMNEFARIDVTALLGQVRCPTLVLHSRRDVRQPFEESRLLASAIPGAQLVPIDSGNHLLLGDEPGWKHWIDQVSRFVARHAMGGQAGAFAGLTPRQRELLELLAQGRDNAQIAAALSLSDKTVRNHVSRLLAQLEVENRSQAIVKARDAGFGAASG
ncbi:alpha/beta fold hydrolase [Piscinibacter sp. HJYY11]|uniref:alpha/beta fold hydrolase n=1 Tax=Piscinibacter sp. HJYY11 TaxID=2801333 RepID=UPI00191E20B1|nr:alpha/beta fold hydrolase [Piscinibacter sp. HJYY11]MBL0727282.1 alpha/beta fold hydrolase [Piscinibacter sp. HJYY11]